MLPGVRREEQCHMLPGVRREEQCHMLPGVRREEQCHMLPRVRKEEQCHMLPATSDVAADVADRTSETQSSVQNIGSGFQEVADHYHLKLNNGKIEDVVVKRLRTGQPLKAEARVLQELAGGAPLYGVTNKPPALVMEFCPGLTITKAVTELNIEDLKHVHYAAFIAIRDFHAAGFYNRSLHGDNVLINTTLPFKCHIIDVADAKKSSIKI
ncbi:hypothetical protein Hamer_G006910 [Homarus americanus]|uniref:Protein kinase domain-containing protein n=1 Tax=Homarus americanus TaxID=6706 RepID=A0A8J5N436_HOMAM|nr:hypothetical protein Hamer_G006910 [Homarus americanus]